MPLLRSMMAALGIAVLARADEPEGIHWPSFRGPGASGIAAGRAAPLNWSVPAGRNVRWKTEIPGLGHSSPAIWGDRIFITTAASAKDGELKVGLYGDIDPVIGEGPQTWKVICIAKADGKFLWERDTCSGEPRVKRHPKSTHANPTPATDGKRVVACFGSEGLYGYDLEGNLLWSKDLGLIVSAYYVVPDAQWGFASSPVLHSDRVILQCDGIKDSFLAVFDAATGDEVWRAPRDDVPTWSTPAIRSGDSGVQIIVNGLKHIGGYDFATGKEIWKLRGGGDIPVPTPLIWEDLVFITNAHGFMSPIYAIRADSSGDISMKPEKPASAHIAWWQARGGNYMQTPIVWEGRLYCCSDNGIISSYEARTGKQIYRKRLAGGDGFTASPVASGGRLYFTSEQGDVYAVRPGDELEILATNPLGEICMSTPAISDGVIYFRARSHLIAIGEDPAGGARAGE